MPYWALTIFHEKGPYGPFSMRGIKKVDEAREAPKDRTPSHANKSLSNVNKR